MPESAHSPLARFVLFLIGLSILGCTVAGTHYYVIDLPQQHVQAPANTLMTCSQFCDAQYYACFPYCKGRSDMASCRSNCQTEYTSCKATC